MTTIFAAAVVILTTAGYVPVGGRDGVEVSLRKDSAIVDLVATGEFKATPAEVERALLSYEDHPGYLKRVAKSQVLSRGPHSMVVYQQLKMPVISDRDYTLAVSWDEQGTRFHVANEQGPPATKKVRMTVLDGSWTLESVRPGVTRATYRVRMDVGGSVPFGMVRNGTVKEIPDAFVAYRKLIEAQRQSASLQ
jgi:hypothetical protein